MESVGQHGIFQTFIERGCAHHRWVYKPFSIKYTFKSASNIKSKPNSSKQHSSLPRIPTYFGWHSLSAAINVFATCHRFHASACLYLFLRLRVCLKRTEGLLRPSIVFIGVSVFNEVVTILIDRVVRQVFERILQFLLVQIVFMRAQAHHTFVIHVHTQGVEACHHDIETAIKLSVIDQIRVSNVPLHLVMLLREKGKVLADLRKARDGSPMHN